MLIILCGKSASGKDTIREGLVRKFGYERFISCTTRPIRQNETDGKEYHFLSVEEFMKREWIEARSYETNVGGHKDMWYYGTEKQVLDPNRNYVAIKDPEGAKKLRDYYGADNTAIVYLDIPDYIRTERAGKRPSFDLTEWNRRLQADSRDFADIKEIADWEIRYEGTVNPDFDVTTVEAIRQFLDNPLSMDCSDGLYLIDRYKVFSNSLNPTEAVHEYLQNRVDSFLNIEKNMLDAVCAER